MNYDFNIKSDIYKLKQYVVSKHQKEGIKTISISSVDVDETKAVLSIELAKCLSRDNHKTLLIDLDLGTPSIAKKLGIRDKYGITDYVGKIQTKNNVVIKQDYNLDLILTGSEIKHVNNFLNSGILNNAIYELAKDYEYVIINSAPFNELKNVVGPSNYVDGAILCIEENGVSRKDLIKVKSLIDKASINLMGIIMTGVKGNTEVENTHKYNNVVFDNNVSFKAKDTPNFKVKNNSSNSSLYNTSKSLNIEPLYKEEDPVYEKTREAEVKEAKPATKHSKKKVQSKPTKKLSSKKSTKKEITKQTKASPKREVSKPTKKVEVKKTVAKKTTSPKKPAKDVKATMSEMDRIKLALAKQKLKDKK